MSRLRLTGSAAKGRRAAALPRYEAPALEKGLDIVELLAAEPDALGQQQIAQRLGRSSSEIFRMLDVLERRGWIARRADGAYATTLTLFELAHRQAPVHRLLAAAMPQMQALARDTRQSNHLVVHYERRVLVIAQVDSPEPMGFSVRQGAHFPFRADRVSAWVLTAFAPPEQRAEPARRSFLSSRLSVPCAQRRSARRRGAGRRTVRASDPRCRPSASGGRRRRRS